MSSPSHGPTSSCSLPTSLSRWAAATSCPFLPGKHYEDWELDDPAGMTLDKIRPIRDEIRDRVANLIEKLSQRLSQLCGFRPGSHAL